MEIILKTELKILGLLNTYFSKNDSTYILSYWILMIMKAYHHLDQFIVSARDPR